MNKIWENRLDDKYDVFVEGVEDGYKGFFVIMEGDIELLREEVSISYGAKFGPDVADVAEWEQRCVDFIDELGK
jgi:hypothetical protein